MDFWMPVLEDTIEDGLKILPYLFFTYLIMEYLEHRTGAKTQKAGKFGPLFGGLIGAFPQCGFSAAASNLYAGRVITLGTLIAIYLSTSDEMVPLFISEQVPVNKMIPIIGMKAFLGIFYGFIIDFAVRNYRKFKHRAENDPVRIEELCKREHCHCEEDTPKISAHRAKSDRAEPSSAITKASVKENSHHHNEGHGNILRSALIHTLHIFIYVFIFTFLLNTMIEYVGEDALDCSFSTE